MPNYGVNAPVRPVPPLACASVAPGRPARYALRWAALRSAKRNCSQLPGGIDEK